MKKRHYVALAIVLSIISLAGALWWLTVKVLPNLGIAHLVPLTETHQLTQNGSAMVIYKNSNFEGYRNFESIETGWSGVGAAWPHILVGMILGAVAGYIMGLPERYFIEFAEKSVAHSKEMLRIAEKKESDAAREMSAAKVKESRNSERSIELAKERKEVDHQHDEAGKLIAYAHVLIREADEKDIELTKAQAKIRRLGKRSARPAGKKSVDEVDKPV
jgi:hypothetical protein